MIETSIGKVTDIEVEGIEMSDYPDFCNAFISAASIQNEDGSWREATDEEIDDLNEDSDLVYESVLKQLY